MKISTLFLSLAIFFCSTLAWAEHSGVATTHRDAIQNAMKAHIKDVTEHNANGRYPVLDPDSKTIVQLKLKGFHDSVELKGRNAPYFVSCADFTADDGTPYDLDFLVSRKYAVVGTLVHSKGGEYFSYDIP